MVIKSSLIRSFDIKEKALDHWKENKTVLAYTNKANYVQRLKPLMDFWSDYILSLLNGVKNEF